MFRRVLIANRGEIAIRIATTCHRLGIHTIAVHSDADRLAQHVAACDSAVALHGNSAQETYLNIPKLIEAAHHSGAEAIHPGYGFLSENAAFAHACQEGGIAFIGPPIQAIETMGSKAAAKELLRNSVVPLIPGYHGKAQDEQTLAAAAAAIGYPILIKASNGGGGKGMRVVENPATFAAALAACQREAHSSFGDATVLLEKYMPRARHIEVQVFADTHGNYVHLFERDCSMQRRHQKVVEEAPAPGLNEDQRQAICQAAIAVAQQVDYVGAGTVEFIVPLNDNGAIKEWFFMEMNTRLQVEHPVTEMITGLDLVAWQIQVAAGLPLPLRQQDIQRHGHAIEARLYAENPRAQFLPSIGTLHHYRLPQPQPACLRIDNGFTSGDEVTPWYDPMLAKLIAWAPERSQAIERLTKGLAEVETVGIHNNAGFLQRLLNSEDFYNAHLDTAAIARHLDVWIKPASHTDKATTLAAAFVIAAVLQAREVITPTTPWQARDHFRLFGSVSETFTLISPQGEEVVLTLNRDVATRQHLTLNDHGFAFNLTPSGAINLELGDQRCRARVLRHPTTGEWYLFHDGESAVWRVIDPLALGTAEQSQDQQLVSPLPGTVVNVAVKEGDVVKAADVLITIEAMKMEHSIRAPYPARVKAVHFKVGDRAPEGVELVSLEAIVEAADTA